MSNYNTNLKFMPIEELKSLAGLSDNDISQLVSLETSFDSPVLKIPVFTIERYTGSESSELDFGDFCMIEQKRHGGPNEMYQHKVIGRLKSNCYVDVPLQTPAEETIHPGDLVEVLACICCGIQETTVLKYRAIDCIPYKPLQ